MMKPGQSHAYQKSFSQSEFDRFAALTGDDNPIHVDPAFAARTKFGKTVAHGMLLYSTIIHVLGDGLPGPGTKQISQELMFPSPTFVGEKVKINLEVLSQSLPGVAEISTSLQRPSGELGCTGKTQVFLPGCHDRETDVPQESPAPSPPHPYGTVQTLRGLTLGETANQTYLISKADHSQYLDLFEEGNPLHTDIGYVQNLGYRDLLLTGGELGGMLSDLLGTHLPGPGTNWLKQRFRFLKPAYPGQPISGHVRIVRLRPEKDLVNLQTWLTDTQGELILTGESLVWVSDLERNQNAKN